MRIWTLLGSVAFVLVGAPVFAQQAPTQPAPAPTAPAPTAPPPTGPAPASPTPAAPASSKGGATQKSAQSGSESEDGDSPPQPGAAPPGAPTPSGQTAPATPPGPYYEAPAPAPAEPASEPVQYEGTTGVVEPPPPPRLPPLEPLPPPEPQGRLAPREAFWVGARAEYLIPTGAVWTDGRAFGDPAYCCTYANQRWRDYANSGLALEADAGARLARRYTVFAFWEHAFLSDGDEPPAALGKQTSALSDFWGLGVRFSTQPSSLGFMVELGLGYRTFSAEWDGSDTLAGAAADEDDPFGRVPNSGGRIELADDFISSRIGVGADIRLAQNFAISPMVFLNGGTFGDIDFKTNEGESVEPVDGAEVIERLRASYATITFSLGGHFDIY